MGKKENAAVVGSGLGGLTDHSGEGCKDAKRVLAGDKDSTKAAQRKAARRFTHQPGSALWNLAYKEGEEALRWSEKNPQAWDWAVSAICADARAGRNPNVQATFKVLRCEGLRDAQGRVLPFAPVRFRNDLIPAWCRIIEAGLIRGGEYRAAALLRSHMKGSWFDSEGMPWAEPESGGES